MTSEKKPEILVPTTTRTSPEPILVLMRHATRDFLIDALSDEGERQASTLGHLLRQRGWPNPSHIQSSPKTRTRQTVRRLETEVQIKSIINSDLDERRADETQAAFETRVDTYCETVRDWALNFASRSGDQTARTAAPLWLACTHLDWLEAAVWRLPSDENDFERSEPWPPMTLRAFVWREGLWRRLNSGGP